MSHKLLLAALPFAGSALYLAYLHVNLSRKVQCQTTHYLQDESITVPPTVRDRLDKYIVHHERVRKSISTASLKIPSSESEILTLFLRRTMTTFAKLPPAWSIWYLIKDSKERGTFDPDHINSLQFAPGDRVCGVYVVSSRDAERITLDLDAPKSYTGPQAEGMLVIEIKDDGNETTLFNNTVMWREKNKGHAGVLESAIGSWIHGLMVRILVERSAQQLLAELQDKKAL